MKTLLFSAAFLLFAINVNAQQPAATEPVKPTAVEGGKPQTDKVQGRNTREYPTRKDTMKKPNSTAPKSARPKEN